MVKRAAPSGLHTKQSRREGMPAPERGSAHERLLPGRLAVVAALPAPQVI